MEQEILNIINKTKTVSETKDKNKKIAIFLNDLPKLNEERFKSKKYNSDIAVILRD